MSEPTDSFPLNIKEPEPWDRAGAPTEVPFLVQEKAIEDLLREEPGPMPVVEPPDDLAAEMSAPGIAVPPEVAATASDPDTPD